MKLGVFAFGHAGCRIAEQFRREEVLSRTRFIKFTMAFDTAPGQLDELNRVDDSWKYVYGRQRFGGRGTRADFVPALEAAEEAVPEFVMHRMQTPGASLGEIDAFLVIGSLGGGTGASGAPVCANTLAEQYPNIPLYSVGVLPATTEEGLYQLNASQSIKLLARVTDNVFLFDNEQLGVSLSSPKRDGTGGSDQAAAFKEVNRELARVLHVVFTADECEEGGEFAGAILDTETLIHSLGSGGLSTMHCVTSLLPRDETPGAIGGFWRVLKRVLGRETDTEHSSQGTDDTDELLDIGADDDKWATGWPVNPSLDTDTIPTPINLLPYSLHPDAAMLSGDTTSFAKSLHLLVGPTRHMTRDDIISASEWVAENADSGSPIVKAYPRKKRRVSVVTVCSGMGIPNRVEELQRDARVVEEHFFGEDNEEMSPKDVNVFEDGEELSGDSTDSLPY